MGIGSYIADFYAHDERLVVELDGSVHDTLSAQEYDLERDRYFKNLGITTLRFRNDQVLDGTDFVKEIILGWVRKVNDLMPPSST